MKLALIYHITNGNFVKKSIIKPPTLSLSVFFRWITNFSFDYKLLAVRNEVSPSVTWSITKTKEYFRAKKTDFLTKIYNCLSISIRYFICN